MNHKKHCRELYAKVVAHGFIYSYSKRILLAFSVILLMLGFVSAQTTKTFFNTDINKLATVPVDGHNKAGNINGIRLHDDGVKWGQVNTAPGVYNWKTFDAWMDKATAAKWDVLYTFSDTPKFAASGIPSGQPCATPTPYSCSPPKDVNEDGSGTDAYWILYVTAVTARYGDRIAFYECWNEADSHNFWAGTTAQLVRMCTDAATIIRGKTHAKITSPSFHGPVAWTWFDGFIKAGGRFTFDYVNVHGRGKGTSNIKPETFLDVWAQVQGELTRANVNYPVFDGEWGPLRGQIPDRDMNAAFYARGLVLRASVGVVRQYQYMWDATDSALQSTRAGNAWNVVSGWLKDKETAPCTVAVTVYSCRIVGGGLIVWDTAKSCSKGVCTSSTYTFPVGTRQYVDLNGDVYPVKGKTVKIGARPIQLQN